MKSLDVICLGSAIVDVFVDATDDDLSSLGLQRSSMTLVGRELALEVTGRFPIKEMKSGGSAANTASALATLGVGTGFVGLYDQDELGESFVREMRETGVRVFEDFIPPGLGTGRCLVFVTRDGERTMATYLGAAAAVSNEHLENVALDDAKTIFVEGYLLEIPAVRETISKLAPELVKNGANVVLSLSDYLLVKRMKKDILELMRDGAISMLFGNEAEYESLLDISDMEYAAHALAEQEMKGVITLGPNGARGFSGEDHIQVPADSKVEVVDTTGAGDIFAAGFLFGMAREFDLQTCCQLGVDCATEVISHYGARPAKPLLEVVSRYL